MKQFIVLVACLMLGLFIYDLIAGEGEGSIYSSVKNVWKQEIENRTMEDKLP